MTRSEQKSLSGKQLSKLLKLLKGAESVELKLTVPESDQRSAVEVDAMPGGFVCSGSLKGRLDRTAVQEVLDGQRPARKLFTKEQRRFFDSNVAEGPGLDDRTALGPIDILKLKFSPKEYGRRLVAELW